MRNRSPINYLNYKRAAHVGCLANSALRSSDEWFTPPAILNALGKFDLDPACSVWCPNRTARRRIGPPADGLAVPWKGRVWLNPPFSNVAPWVYRMIEHGNGIMLSFARSDAKWFQDAIAAAGCVFLLKGRTEFQRLEGKGGRCPLGCALIPFGLANRSHLIMAGLGELPGQFLYTR